ncbi:hypothetical protein AMR76_20790 [Vibrio furnissii]|uniref:FRG domain-containing protein n=1 Tax=Vibrio furnissii TaxID=29494 RepID=A0A0Q2UTH4_VIBFU|nr:FRG domain-containing protein [Vibrio furnissii]KQH83888.1 hypothetical protein AMR76_20790 [Vibrio furnissii]
MEKYVATSLSEYISIATSIVDQVDDVWFRGHASASYRLTPSVLRDSVPLTDGRGNQVEDGQIVISEGGTVTGINPERMFYEFKSRAMPFLDREPKNNFEWMFLMQHYGLPTRLLDWTENALVALFFALESFPKSEEEKIYDHTASEEFLEHDEFCPHGAAVFVVSPSRLNEISIGRSDKIYISEEPDKWESYFDPMNKPSSNYTPIAIQSSHIDTRIRSQLGHFTLHGANIWPLDYYTTLRNVLNKIFIPYEYSLKIFHDLQALGISESFIYPGLESLSRDIKRKEISYFLSKLV